MSDYYDNSSNPADNSFGDPSLIRAEFLSIHNGISLKLPALAGNGGKVVAIKADASGLETIAATGTGNAVLATSPTLVTPLLGTPTSGNLINCTGYAASGLGGLGTGVATFLATPSSANLAAALTDETGSGAAVFASSPTLVTPLLGTPTSGNLINCTGYAASGLGGLGTGVATFLATPSSANLAAALTDETGSGAAVFASSPTLVTPVLGAASATSVNKLTLTAPATSATLTIADGGSLVTSGAYSVTLTASGATNVTLPTTGTLAVLAANSFTGDQTLGNNNLKTIKTATFNGEVNIASTSGTVNLDFTTGQNFKQTELTGAITYTFTAPPGPCHMQIRGISDGVSSPYTITLPSGTWYGTAFTTSTSNKKWMVNIWYDGAAYHYTGMSEV